MKSGKISVFFAVVFAMSGVSHADTADLNTALQNTYRACVDIDENLHDLKVLAGVNTAVTAVGTASGVGASATGFAKASKDTSIERLERLIKEIEEIQSKDTDIDNFDKEKFLKEFDVSWESAVKDIDKYKEEIEKLTEQSKKLGNWRTGLLAGNTATNIAGAIIASRTIINKDDIQGQIDACILANKELNNAITAAKLNGEDVAEAKQIYDICREYEFVDISPITKRGKGAMVASTTGAVVGGVGTITSAVANSDKIRNDNSEAGKKKEKDLNTASNVLSVGATAASATATVFNALQINAIKKVATVASECTGVLK